MNYVLAMTLRNSSKKNDFKPDKFKSLRKKMEKESYYNRIHIHIYWFCWYKWTLQLREVRAWKIEPASQMSVMGLTLFCNPLLSSKRKTRDAGAVQVLNSAWDSINIRLLPGV